MLREIDERDFYWMYKCDDDTWMIMKNLRQLLLSLRIKANSSTTPLFLVYRMILQWCCLGSLCLYDALCVFLHLGTAPTIYTICGAKREHVETRSRGGLYYASGGGIRYDLGVFKIAGIVSQWNPLPITWKLSLQLYSLCHCAKYLHRIQEMNLEGSVFTSMVRKFHIALLTIKWLWSMIFFRRSIYEKANWFSDQYRLEIL